MPEFARARFNMVECQVKPSNVTDPRLLDALLEIPREAFLPPSLRGVAYADEDLPIAQGRFLPPAMPIARLIDLAEVRESDLVLDIGSGVGYYAAVLGRLASAVVALESDEELARASARTLVDHGGANVVVEVGRLVEGWPAQAPYDVIVVEGMIETVPAAILEQLAEGGRLVGVIRDEQGIGRGSLVTRVGGVVAHRQVFDAPLPLLPGFERAPAFVF